MGRLPSLFVFPNFRAKLRDDYQIDFLLWGQRENNNLRWNHPPPTLSPPPLLPHCPPPPPLIPNVTMATLPVRLLSFSYQNLPRSSQWEAEGGLGNGIEQNRPYLAQGPVRISLQTVFFELGDVISQADTSV